MKEPRQPLTTPSFTGPPGRHLYFNVPEVHKQCLSSSGPLSFKSKFLHLEEFHVARLALAQAVAILVAA